jgi:hypothetical protein
MREHPRYSARRNLRNEKVRVSSPLSSTDQIFVDQALCPQGVSLVSVDQPGLLARRALEGAGIGGVMPGDSVQGKSFEKGGNRNRGCLWFAGVEASKSDDHQCFHFGSPARQRIAEADAVGGPRSLGAQPCRGPMWRFNRSDACER